MLSTGSDQREQNLSLLEDRIRDADLIRTHDGEVGLLAAVYGPKETLGALSCRLLGKVTRECQAE
jgi:hypothetical protein